MADAAGLVSGAVWSISDHSEQLAAELAPGYFSPLPRRFRQSGYTNHRMGSAALWPAATLRVPSRARFVAGILAEAAPPAISRRHHISGIGAHRSVGCDDRRPLGPLAASSSVISGVGRSISPAPPDWRVLAERRPGRPPAPAAPSPLIAASGRAALFHL